MKITLDGTGKKYYREWIFRNVTQSYEPGKPTVILGPNGSGKSTLLQVIAGAVQPNEGTVTYMENGNRVEDEDYYKLVSFASPYLELIEEFTLIEIIQFHFLFKKPFTGITESEIIKLAELENKTNSIFRFFSSGMKQRVKLSLAILSDTPLLLLDEPCSNLDSNAIAWYKKMMDEYGGGRIIIVASNQNRDEYEFCNREIKMSDLK